MDGIFSDIYQRTGSSLKRGYFQFDPDSMWARKQIIVFPSLYQKLKEIYGITDILSYPHHSLFMV